MFLSARYSAAFDYKVRSESLLLTIFLFVQKCTPRLIFIIRNNDPHGPSLPTPMYIGENCLNSWKFSRYTYRSAQSFRTTRNRFYDEIPAKNRVGSWTVCRTARARSNGRTAVGTTANSGGVSGTAAGCTCPPRTVAVGTAAGGRTASGTVPGGRPAAARTALWTTTANGRTADRTAKARAVGRTARGTPAAGRTAGRTATAERCGRETT